VKGTFLETLTWLEAEKALKRRPVVVTPLGARLKEHGPHLPLNNDWIMAEYLAKRLAGVCPVLILPTVQYSYYPAFVEYPGSVHIGLETSRDLVMDICRSFARHGARRHYILNTGISTLRALAPARKQLAAERIRMEYTDLGEALEAVEKRVRESEGGTHADELETSMMLYMAPEIVRMKKARRDYDPRPRSGGLTRAPDAATGVYSPTGTWGDPTKATRAKGRLLVEALVAHIAKEVRRLARG
jgi:creatinine amidohydrolase